MSDRIAEIRARLATRRERARPLDPAGDMVANAMRAVSSANDDDIEFLLGEVKRLRAALGDLVVDVEDDLPFPVPPDVGAALVGARDALGWEAIDVAGEGQG